MRKSYKQMSILLLLVFSFTVFFGNAAYAKGGPIKLKASTDSEYIFDEVELLQVNDEETKIRVKGYRDAGSKPESIAIEVDTNKKTYKAVKTLLAEEATNHDVVDGPITPNAFTTTYNRTLGIVTQDPINIDCCKSWLKLTWTVDLDYNRVISYSRTKGQWDGQPTAGLTYWYLDYHNFGSSGYTSSRAYTQSSAKHYNYDFGNINLATYADHWIYIEGYPSGNYYYEAEWRHTGESNSLLKGKVYFQ